MKTRNYEKKSLIIFLIVIIFISEFIFLLFLIINKECNYEKLNSIVIKDNLVLVMASKKERKLIYNNSILYYKDRKYKYKLVEDRGKLLKQGYYELVLEFNFNNKNIKTNDILELVFVKEKIRLIELFKFMWEGD